VEPASSLSGVHALEGTLVLDAVPNCLKEAFTGGSGFPASGILSPREFEQRFSDTRARVLRLGFSRIRGRPRVAGRPVMERSDQRGGDSQLKSKLTLMTVYRNGATLERLEKLYWRATVDEDGHYSFAVPL